ncbi:MAG: glycosyltransferase, partial [Pseudomonadota bacterium]|nr:glycosyltransferase [Pseudomonadota bacterium]
DTAAFSPRFRDQALRAQWNADPQAPVAIHVGRIAAEKNLGLAVRAFRALQQAQPRARMVFVGDGPERARLARENPDFVFCGVHRGEALARHFASADLFVFPSRSETFGNVTLEALASGVPTIAFAYGAAREHMVGGVHGAAVADGDDDGFVRALVRIGDDAGLRARMASAAAAAVAGLQPSRVAADFDDILQSLAAAGRNNALRAIA